MAADLQAEIERLADTRAVLSHSDLEQCYRIATALDAVSNENLDAALAQSRPFPVLQAYMSDGWSARTSFTTTSVEHGVLVKRVGHYRHEFLLERALLRTRSPGTGEQTMHMLFGPPRGLRYGKNAWNMLTAATQFCPMLRARGHNGIALNLYLMDGMLIKRFTKMAKARHALFYTRGMGVYDKDNDDAR